MIKIKNESKILIIVAVLTIIVVGCYLNIENSSVKLLNYIGNSDLIKIEFIDNDIINTYRNDKLVVLKESIGSFVRFKHSKDMIKNSILTSYCTFTIGVKGKDVAKLDVYLIDIEKIDDNEKIYFHELNGKYYVFKYKTYYYTFDESINLNEL